MQNDRKIRNELTGKRRTRKPQTVNKMRNR